MARKGLSVLQDYLPGDDGYTPSDLEDIFSSDSEGANVMNIYMLITDWWQRPDRPAREEASRRLRSLPPGDAVEILCSWASKKARAVNGGDTDSHGDLSADYMYVSQEDPEVSSHSVLAEELRPRALPGDDGYCDVILDTIRLCRDLLPEAPVPLLLRRLCSCHDAVFVVQHCMRCKASIDDILQCLGPVSLIDVTMAVDGFDYGDVDDPGYAITKSDIRRAAERAGRPRAEIEAAKLYTEARVLYCQEGAAPGDRRRVPV